MTFEILFFVILITFSSPGCNLITIVTIMQVERYSEGHSLSLDSICNGIDEEVASS